MTSRQALVLTKKRGMCERCPCEFCASCRRVCYGGRQLILRALVSFIDSIDNSTREKSDNTQNMDSWFTATYGVSPLFLRLFYPSDESYRNDGGSSFPRKDFAGNLISLGTYFNLMTSLLIPKFLPVHPRWFLSNCIWYHAQAIVSLVQVFGD